MSEKAKPEKPICPYCKAEMKPIKYVGYYDEFCYWECNCSEMPNAEKHRGQYA